MFFATAALIKLALIVGVAQASAAGAGSLKARQDLPQVLCPVGAIVNDPCFIGVPPVQVEGRCCGVEDVARLVCRPGTFDCVPA
ncbi:hypothetical protein C8Q76DRAFT_750288 [Earliella scabrosa]|nr:hypothetical protein C8Q76DRAFT_750288 [Earliella scabrosa]